MATEFTKLNEGWNAEPNAPDPQVQVEGNDVLLSFDMNAFQFPQYGEGDRGTIRFADCSRYRLGPTNDEGWYRRQCRFSGLAPAWGEFYEVRGDLMFDKVSQAWLTLRVRRDNERHFLFYLRNSTFECDAMAWHLTVSRAAQRVG